MKRNRQQLLDPFAFPSETKGRFLLLVVAALALLWSIAVVLSEWLTGFSYLDLILSSIDRMEKVVAGEGTWSPVNAENLLLVWSLLAMPAILLGIAGVIATVTYLTHSLRIRWRYRSRIVAPDPTREAHKLLDYVRCVSTKIGLEKPPSVMFQSRGKGGGRAFGLKNHESLLLNGSPSFWEKSWGPVPESIVLHELAHVKNNDAQDRERVKAVWFSVLMILTLTVPLALIELRQAPKGFLTLWLCQLALLILTIRLTWGGLIRARELYADWRVASWGRKEPLYRFLSLPELRTPWWIASFTPLRKIWRAWELHPSHEKRRMALDDPSMLFKVTPDLPLTTGFILPVVVFNLLPPFSFALSVISQIYARTRLAITETTGPLSLLSELRMGLLTEALFLLATFGTFSMLFLLVSHLTMKALGVQIQKETVADLASGDHSRWGYVKLLGPSFLLALGIELALSLTPMYTALVSLSSVLHFLPNNLFEILATLAWLTGSTFLIWLWMVYIRAMTRFSLGAHAGRAKPEKIELAISWSSNVLLVALSWPAIAARFLISMASSQIPWLNSLVIAYDPSYLYYKYLFLPIAVVSLSLIFYVLWAGSSLLVCCYTLLAKKARCPSCNEISELKLIIGRRCDLCGDSPALWTHAKAEDGFPC